MKQTLAINTLTNQSPRTNCLQQERQSWSARDVEEMIRALNLEAYFHKSHSTSHTLTNHLNCNLERVK